MHFKYPQPRHNLLTEQRDFHALKECRVGLQPSQCCIEQRCSTSRVVSLKMMECRRHLNQSLQKGLLWFLAIQPDTLPMLVSQEEFLTSVTAKSVGKRSEIQASLPPVILLENRKNNLRISWD